MQFPVGKTWEERFFEKITTPCARKNRRKTRPKTIRTARCFNPRTDFPSGLESTRTAVKFMSREGWAPCRRRQRRCPLDLGIHAGGFSADAPLVSRTMRAATRAASPRGQDHRSRWRNRPPQVPGANKVSVYPTSPHGAERRDGGSRGREFAISVIQLALLVMPGVLRRDDAGEN